MAEWAVSTPDSPGGSLHTVTSVDCTADVRSEQIRSGNIFQFLQAPFPGAPSPKPLGQSGTADLERRGEDGDVAAIGSLSEGEFLRFWATFRVGPGEILSRTDLADRLAADVAWLDQAIGRQLDGILHHRRFQALESAWRGLDWLVEQVDDAIGADQIHDSSHPVRVRLLNCSKRELHRDHSQAVEFDRSMLWRKIYEDEFGTAGGDPFGMLVVDHSFGIHPDDIDLLTGLAEVAAASFAPLVAAPEPDLLGVDSFADLNTGPTLESLYTTPQFTPWRSLKALEETRFLGLALPRILGRLPYDGWELCGARSAQTEQSWAERSFRYHEDVEGARGERRLWINAGWALASVVVREFVRSGWFADIRGASRGEEGSGLVAGLPIDDFAASEGLAFRGPTEVLITESAEHRLSEAGFIPLCAAGSDGRAVFHSNQSLHRAKHYDSPRAAANARISSMLQYMLCVSRFAHYIKAIARNKVGSVSQPDQLEAFLDEWIHSYATPDDHATPETRARLPLRAAQVEVRETPGSPGAYRIVMHLQPHFQLDDLASSIRLTTVIRRATPS